MGQTCGESPPAILLGEIPCTAYYTAKRHQKVPIGLDSLARIPILQAPADLPVTARAGQVPRSLTGFSPRKVPRRTGREKGDNLIQVGESLGVVAHGLIGSRTLEVGIQPWGKFHRVVEILQRLRQVTHFTVCHPTQGVCICEFGIPADGVAAIGDYRRVVIGPQVDRGALHISIGTGRLELMTLLKSATAGSLWPSATFARPRNRYAFILKQTVTT